MGIIVSNTGKKVNYEINDYLNHTSKDKTNILEDIYKRLLGKDETESLVDDIEKNILGERNKGDDYSFEEIKKLLLTPEKGLDPTLESCASLARNVFLCLHPDKIISIKRHMLLVYKTKENNENKVDEIILEENLREISLALSKKLSKAIDNIKKELIKKADEDKFNFVAEEKEEPKQETYWSPDLHRFNLRILMGNIFNGSYESNSKGLTENFSDQFTSKFFEHVCAYLHKHHIITTHYDMQIDQKEFILNALKEYLLNITSHNFSNQLNDDSISTKQIDNGIPSQTKSSNVNLLQGIQASLDSFEAVQSRRQPIKEQKSIKLTKNRNRINPVIPKVTVARPKKESHEESIEKKVEEASSQFENFALEPPESISKDSLSLLWETLYYLSINLLPRHYALHETYLYLGIVKGNSSHFKESLALDSLNNKYQPINPDPEVHAYILNLSLQDILKTPLNEDIKVKAETRVQNYKPCGDIEDRIRMNFVDPPLNLPVEKNENSIPENSRYNKNLIQLDNCESRSDNTLMSQLCSFGNKSAVLFNAAVLKFSSEIKPIEEEPLVITKVLDMLSELLAIAEKEGNTFSAQMKIQSEFKKLLGDYIKSLSSAQNLTLLEIVENRIKNSLESNDNSNNIRKAACQQISVQLAIMRQELAFNTVTEAKVNNSLDTLAKNPKKMEASTGVNKVGTSTFLIDIAANVLKIVSPIVVIAAFHVLKVVTNEKIAAALLGVTQVAAVVTFGIFKSTQEQIDPANKSQDVVSRKGGMPVQNLIDSFAHETLNQNKFHT